jgi:hypothetical protein
MEPAFPDGDVAEIIVREGDNEVHKFGAVVGLEELPDGYNVLYFPEKRRGVYEELKRINIKDIEAYFRYFLPSE